MTFRFGEPLAAAKQAPKFSSYDVALDLLTRAGYQYSADGTVITVKDPVHGYRADGSYGVVEYNDFRLYSYLGTSILGATVRFIEDRS